MSTGLPTPMSFDILFFFSDTQLSFFSKLKLMSLYEGREFYFPIFSIYKGHIYSFDLNENVIKIWEPFGMRYIC